MRRAALTICFVLVSIAVYWPVLQPGSGFVWDDDAELWGTRGQLVLADDGPLQAWWPIVEPEEGWHRIDRWRPVVGLGAWPLTPTVFWLEWRAFGAKDLWRGSRDRGSAIAAVSEIAWRFHWPNVLLHALAAVSIVAILQALGIPAAAWVGLVFLVHPLCVPSVAWVSELKNTLSLPLLLLSILLYLKWDQRDGDRRRPLLGVGSWLAFGLSLTAKTSGVGLPVVLLALVAFRRRALTLADLRASAPFFALGLAMSALTLWFTAKSGGLVELGPAPGGLVDRLALALVVPWFYLEKIFLPLDLTMIYPQIDAGFGGLAPWLPLFALAVPCGLAWRARRGWGTAWLAAVAAFGALLFPVLGLFRMTYAMHAPVADHFVYAAVIVPLALVIGGGAAWLDDRSPTARRLAGVGLLAAVIWLGWTSHQRARDWTGHEALWTQNVRVHPDAWMARYNLGSVLGTRAEAMDEGAARDALLEQADAHLARAIELEPRYSLARFRRAAVLRALRRDDAALAALAGAVTAAETTAGVDSVETALLRAEYARALAQSDDLLGARRQYEAALAVVPELTGAQLRLANVCLRQGDDAAAIRVYESLLEREPDHVVALTSAALLRASSDDAQVRDPATALRHADRAERLAPRNDRRKRLRAREARLAAESELAWLTAEGAGRERAIELAGRALALAHQLGRASDVARAEARLARFASEIEAEAPLP